MHCKYPHMFKPLTIKGVTFKNRVFASPITTNRVVSDQGYPTPEAIDVYETKARGGFAEVTITESFIDHEYSWRHEHGLNLWERGQAVYAFARAVKRDHSFYAGNLVVLLNVLQIKFQAT
ncbi:hypothetical protein [Eikenella corrodens]|uniref:NADH:flavin oxidoreductase/NADH oxidase N-terminal domain-containing protein n=1 Tax=Eikenella corrodens TaxID=539 RepID=A0A3S9SM51_EIKCO|nr:hypothetical protein [Eikenella corrodens]AZR60636.1 hypothetical protein ELB75_11885 [Eikenella corrodens]